MAERILRTMPDNTNPELHGLEVSPSSTTQDHEIPLTRPAGVDHGITTSEDAQRQADAISAELGSMFPPRVQTAPATPRVDIPVSTAPRLTRRAFVGGAIATGVLGALGLKAWTSRGTNAATSSPTPSFVDGSKVPGGPAGGVPPVDGGTPTAPRAAGILDGTATPTTDPNVLPALQTAEAKWGNAWNTAVAGVNTQTASQGPDRTATPGATKGPDSTPVAISTPPKEGTSTPEVKREFSVSVNIIQPGDPKYEVVFGRIEAIPIKSVGLNPEYRHPSGLNAEQMQKRANAYGQAAARYSSEWWQEQVVKTGKRPPGSPPDVGFNNPKIQEYMAKNEPYQFPVWNEERMFNIDRLAGDETIDPLLGYDVNIIPVSADIVTKMRNQSIPAGKESTYRTGVNKGRLSYNLFITPKELAVFPAKLNGTICHMIFETQEQILLRGKRDIGMVGSPIDPNLIDMFFSTTPTASSVPNVMKVGSPIETPLYIGK